MIAGLLFCGFGAVQSGAATAVGAITLVSGSSSLLGYLGILDAPVFRFVRSNFVSVICTIMCCASLF